MLATNDIYKMKAYAHEPHILLFDFPLQLQIIRCGCTDLDLKTWVARSYDDAITLTEISKPFVCSSKNCVERFHVTVKMTVLYKAALLLLLN